MFYGGGWGLCKPQVARQTTTKRVNMPNMENCRRHCRSTQRAGLTNLIICEMCAEERKLKHKTTVYCLPSRWKRRDELKEMPGERLKGHCTARVMKTLLKQSAAAKTKKNGKENGKRKRKRAKIAVGKQPQQKCHLNRSILRWCRVQGGASWIKDVSVATTWN